MTRRQLPLQAPGRLYVFEGPDGVGKSGVLAAVAEALKDELNGSPVLASFPGKALGTLGRLVYDLHHSATTLGVSSLTPMSLQVLHIAAHVDTIERLILPQLCRGRTVLLDRFWWSTWAYGQVAGLDDRILFPMIDIERRCWGSVLPHAVFLFDRAEPLRSEVEASHFHALRKAYRDLCTREEALYPVHRLIDHESVSRSVAEVLMHIRRDTDTASRSIATSLGEASVSTAKKRRGKRGQQSPGPR